MRREEWIRFIDHECCELSIIQMTFLKFREFLKTFESCYHTSFRSELCTAKIRTVFTYTREIHDNNWCKKSEYDLQYIVYQEVWKIGNSSFITIRTWEKSSNDARYDMRKYDNKSIHHTSNKCECYHVTIEHVCHLMTNDSFDFTSFHSIEKSSRDRYESTIFRCTRCESIWFCRFIIPNFWHIDILGFRDTFDCLIDELKTTIFLMKRSWIKKNDSIHFLRLPSRNQERDNCSAEPEYCSKSKKTREVPICCEKIRIEIIHHRHDKPEKNQDCKIGEKKERDSFEISKHDIIFKNTDYDEKNLSFSRLNNHNFIVWISMKNQLDFIILFLIIILVLLF